MTGVRIGTSSRASFPSLLPRSTGAAARLGRRHDERVKHGTHLRVNRDRELRHHGVELAVTDSPYWPHAEEPTAGFMYRACTARPCSTPAATTMASSLAGASASRRSEKVVTRRALVASAPPEKACAPGRVRVLRPRRGRHRGRTMRSVSWSVCRGERAIARAPEFGRHGSCKQVATWQRDLRPAFTFPWSPTRSRSTSSRTEPRPARRARCGGRVRRRCSVKGHAGRP
jgi:hypothetical protein